MSKEPPAAKKLAFKIAECLDEEWSNLHAAGWDLDEAAEYIYQMLPATYEEIQAELDAMEEECPTKPQGPSLVGRLRKAVHAPEGMSLGGVIDAVVAKCEENERMRLLPSAISKGMKDHLDLALKQIAELGTEVDKLKAEHQRLQLELSEMTQAVGLATTAVPSMVLDPKDPIEMMRKVVAEHQRLQGKRNLAYSKIEDGCHLYCSWYDTGKPSMEPSAIAYELVNCMRAVLLILNDQDDTKALEDE